MKYPKITKRNKLHFLKIWGRFLPTHFITCLIRIHIYIMFNRINLCSLWSNIIKLSWILCLNCRWVKRKELVYWKITQNWYSKRTMKHVSKIPNLLLFARCIQPIILSHRIFMVSAKMSSTLFNVREKNQNSIA